MGAPITITHQEPVIIEDRTSWPGAGGFIGDWALVEGFTWIIFFLQGDADWDIAGELQVEQNETLTQPFAAAPNRYLHTTMLTMYSAGVAGGEHISTRINVCARYARVRISSGCGANPTLFRLLCYARAVK